MECGALYFNVCIFLVVPFHLPSLKGSILYRLLTWYAFLLGKLRGHQTPPVLLPPRNNPKRFALFTIPNPEQAEESLLEGC